jgi:hypothetical protein
MGRSSRHCEIPLVIHIVNVVALLLGGLILMLTAVVKVYQLSVLLPVLVLLLVYWRVRTNPRVAAGYFGLSMALLGWILICEHIVIIDKVFGSEISGQLRLDSRLKSYVDTTLGTKPRKYLEPCCDDPLTWHYQPGSLYRATYDWGTAPVPYEVVADETGYLNQQADLRYSDHPIDLFLAGDSVLQGTGVPSVVEWLRALLPLRLWNLSIEGYGPRQRISALIAYALPKQPRWLIVEFYGRNDLCDEIINDVCDSTGDFRCRFNKLEFHRLFAQHPVYQTIFDLADAPTDIFTRLTDTATHNLTLATTQFLLTALKSTIRGTSTAGAPTSAQGRKEEFGDYIGLALPARSQCQVRRSQWLPYLKAGMALTLQSYKRLEAKLEGMEHGATVILLYNPTAYELYRDLWAKPRPEADQASTMQREALREFADTHGWRFLDLTGPLRQEVQVQKLWLYGWYDKTHWSPQGTAVVAPVLARELSNIIGP